MEQRAKRKQSEKLMSKLLVTVALSALLCALCYPVQAQKTKSVPRIGYLAVNSSSVERHLVEAFQQGLGELGWVEGQNIAIEYRFAEGKLDRLPDLAAELVNLKIDVLVATGGTPPALAAKKASTMIPIVFLPVGDPVATGLVASLARPGGNITGLSNMQVGLSGKRLELLKEVVPKVSRVAVLWNPSNPFSELALRETEVAARALRVQLQSLEVRGVKDLEPAFSEMTAARAAALLVMADSMFRGERARLADLAVKNRLPTVLPQGVYVEAGGLMSYGENQPDLWRRAATYVDKILKGAKPADLPVEQPTKFELVINLKTAKQIGLTVPQKVLARADKVIR
jgi:putative ABC transport system substrate-binding protein